MARIGAAVLAAGLLVALAVPVGARAYVATLEITPSSGPPGAVVTADGSDHTPNANIEIRWGDENGQLLAEVQADPGGAYSAPITIPTGTSAGVRRIVACEVDFVQCDDVTHEFHVGAEADFTVVSATTTTGATTTTTAEATTTTEVTTTTLPQGEIPIIGDPDLFDSFVGEADTGHFGPYLTPVDGVQLELFVPRCAPPDGASMYDFDTDWVGYSPRTFGRPEVTGFYGLIGEPPAGTITPRQGIHLRPTENPGRSVIVFAEPQRYVGLYVGDVAETGTPIEMIAVDADNHPVAADRIPSAAPPATTCMAVAVEGEPTITRVILGAATDADLYVDRVFYSADTAMTAPPLPTHGTVEFLRPVTGQELSTRGRQFVLGIIRVPASLPITEVALSVPRWNRAAVDIRHVDFHELWEDGDDRLYSFVGGGIYLPEGEAWMSVTATGPGVIATGAVEVIGVGAPPLHAEDVPGRVDIEPVTIEVTQAVRGRVDLIPPGEAIQERDDALLVRDKPTVARGFARLVFPEGDVFGGTVAVNAELVGTRNGVALPGSPLSPEHAFVEVRTWTDRDASYHSNKQTTELAWNFVLPDSWTTAGRIDLRLEVNSPLLPGHVEELPGYGDERNVIGLNRVRFRNINPPSVNVWLVDYYIKCSPEELDGDGTTRGGFTWATRTPAAGYCMGREDGDIVHAQPSRFDAWAAVALQWRMAPFPGIAPPRFDTWEYVFATDGIRDDELEPGPLLTPGSPRDRFGLGMALRMEWIVPVDGYETLNVLMTSFVRGKAWISPSFFRATTWPETFLHETGHTTGLLHSGGGHDSEGSVSRWGGDHGEVGQSREVVSAFDVLRLRAIPWGTAGGDHRTHDLMSYGDARWISEAAWHHIFDAVTSGNASGDLRGPLSGVPGGGEDQVVTLVGSVDDDGVDLAPAFRLPGAAFVEEGDLRVLVLAADGTVLAESATVLVGEGESPDDTPTFAMPAYVPDDAREMVFLLDGEEIDRFVVAPPPGDVGVPVIDGVEPGAEPIVVDESVEVSWSGTGADGEVFMVEFGRPDGDWMPFAVTEERRVTIDPASLPFQGPGWRIRVQATTGLAVATSAEVPIEFPAKPTDPEIVVPLDGTIVSTNTPIRLRAAVSQYAMGEEDSFVWELDGIQVGQGPEGLTFSDDPGTHTITLRSPETGSEASVTLTVVADFDLDGIGDAWEAEWGLDPTNPNDASTDAEGDLVPAWEEFLAGTSPETVDTDGDLYSDRVEIDAGTDPTDPASIPVADEGGTPFPRLAETPAAEDTGGGSNLPVILVVAALAAAALLGGGWMLMRRR